MDIFSVRQQLKTKSIFDIPLRVTFYARVSSEKDEQLNSLDNQITYYKNYIKNNKKWTYIDGYIDEGISGISTSKRENFQKMIRDADNNKFDLIITKEISRFARNTLDSIQFTRSLLSRGICVFFQNDNINTIDEDSELRLTIMSSIAQDELRKLSSRIKFGHAQAIKNGTVIGNSRIYGYKKDNKRLVVDENETPMIKLIFNLYATNNYSMKQIEDILYEKDYRNHNGNKICHTTLSNIIRNPKYKGYYCGNKVKNINMFTKERKFLPEEEWVMYKDETGEIVPAIIDEETWDRANEILSLRSKDVIGKNNISNHNNLLTGKMYCTCCNRLYYLKSHQQGKIRARWVCSGKLANGKNTCKSFTVFEDEIKEIIFQAFKNSVPNIDDSIATYQRIAEYKIDNTSIKSEITSLNNNIQVEEKKQNKLLELLSTDVINTDDFKRMNDEIVKKMSELKEKLRQLQNQSSFSSDIRKYVQRITEALSNTKNIINANMINRNFIENFIDRILITPINENTMDVRIQLFTDDQYNTNYYKTQTKNIGSTGQTSLEICPVLPIKINRYDRNTCNYTKIITYNTSIYIDNIE